MINNFSYCTPTSLIFGKGVIKKLPDVLKKYGNKVLLTYGGGSIKRIGLYDEIKNLLKDFEIIELSGIEPNPKYDPSVIEGARLCKENNIDVILSVGGGSTLDCSKAIAVCAKYDGEGWDIISGKVKAKDAVPIVDILTLAATGSEYDATRYTTYIGLRFPLNCILLLHRVYVLSIRFLNHHLYSSLKLDQISS